jgi:excisionase family DNA binding protein
MRTAPDDALLDVDEVGRRLGVSRQTVYRLVRVGDLPAIQLAGEGTSLRFDAGALQQWLDAHQTTPRGPRP